MVLFRIRQERHRLILKVPRFSIWRTIKVVSFKLNAIPKPENIHNTSIIVFH